MSSIYQALLCLQVVQVGSSHAVLSPASAATTGGEGADGGSVEAGPSTSSTAAAAAAVADQAAVVKALKDSGLTNQDPDVQREVQVRTGGAGGVGCVVCVGGGEGGGGRGGWVEASRRRAL